MNRCLLPLATLLAVGGCVPAAEPSPAVISTSPPPWPAPRDGVSYIDAAGMPQLPLGDNSDPQVFNLTIIRDGVQVPVAAYVGVDRVRALQAPVHTHDDSGQVWLEGAGNRTVTLGQFFAVWGVRFDGECLGDICGTLEVTADGKPVADPAGLILRTVGEELEVVIAR